MALVSKMTIFNPREWSGKIILGMAKCYRLSPQDINGAFDSRTQTKFVVTGQERNAPGYWV
jgi:hypothetical protein